MKNIPRAKEMIVIIIGIVLLFIGCKDGNNGNVSGPEGNYGPELQIVGDWVIDNETIVVSSEQPIYFPQDYHEQHKIIVRNGGVLKITGSYIRSDFRFLLELYDTSKLIVENSSLEVQEAKGAVILNMDYSTIEAQNSSFDYVGIGSGVAYSNHPSLYTTVDLVNCNIGQLVLDLSNITNFVVEGIGTGTTDNLSLSSEQFRITLKNCKVRREVTSWIGEADVTYRNCNMGQISPGRRSKVTIENSTVREIVPCVYDYSGLIANLPRGFISSFQLNLPETQGPSINIINSTIENGWYFKYFQYYSGSNIEFRNCYFSVLRPMGTNSASIYDSIVKELWIWQTSGEIFFQNSPISWIGNIMGPNDISLSGHITVEDQNWRKRELNWNGTILKREFFFSRTSGSGECIIRNEEEVIVDQFAVGISPTSKVLVFDKEQRYFKVYLNGMLKKNLELSSNADVIL